MFDKNDFKNKFKDWISTNPYASFHEAQTYIYKSIPEAFKLEYNWLIEQSLNWFLWRKEISSKQRMAELTEILENENSLQNYKNN